MDVVVVKVVFIRKSQVLKPLALLSDKNELSISFQKLHSHFLSH
jgi:hypothetical protein